MDIWPPPADRSSVARVSTNAVLLAEREPGSRESIEQQLRDDGFTVFGAAWTARALDLAERLMPNVVIAGDAELCRKIRAGEPGRTWDRNIPMILLTDPDADWIVRVRALESGADDVVPRDVYLELRARVRALLRRASLGQAEVLEAGPIVVDHRPQPSDRVQRQIRPAAVEQRLGLGTVSIAGRHPHVERVRADAVACVLRVVLRDVLFDRAQVGECAVDRRLRDGEPTVTGDHE